MHIPKRVQKVKVLYYYFLFLYALGLSTLSSCGVPEKQQTEDIDEDKDDEKQDVDAYYEVDDNIWVDDDLLDEDRFDGEAVDDSQLDDVLLDEDGEISDEDVAECALPTMAKNWAQIMVFDGYSKAPIVNSIPAWSVMIAQVSISQNCEKLTTTYKMCSIEVDDDNSLIEAVVPPSFYLPLPLVDKEAVLTEEGSEVHFNQPAHYEHRSCIADNPADDLPTDENDPRVQDWDNDEVPGLMIQSEGVLEASASMCQKIMTTLDGVVSPTKIEGLVEWYEWQQVYWYSSALLKDGSPTFPGEDKSKSYFYMIPIGDSDGCDYILEHKEELFDGYIPAPGK